MTGTLYLLPNLLCDEADLANWLPQSIHQIVALLDLVICESEKPARRFLGHFKRASMPLKALNEHTNLKDLPEFLQPLLDGKNVGLLSDAGLPCLADPGAELVHLAHQRNIRVQAISGPSSLFLAIMLSGLGGQRFSFHGYLPRDPNQRTAFIRKIEQKSSKEESSELFIEAPYRNGELLKALIECLQPTTELAIVCDLSAPTECVVVRSVAELKKQPPVDIHKRPTVFVLRAKK